MEAMRDLLSEDTPAATRFNAAKWVLEYDQEVADGEDKPLSEMTEAELRGVIERAQVAVEEHRTARIIDVTPENGA